MMPDPGLGACLVACQQSAQTSGAGGGGAGCAGCVQQQGCFPTGCLQNTACQAWGQCVLGCGNQGPACYASCDAAHLGAQAFYDPFYACACNGCSSQCSAQVDPCSHVPPGTTGSGMSGSTGSGM